MRPPSICLIAALFSVACHSTPSQPAAPEAQANAPSSTEASGADVASPGSDADAVPTAAPEQAPPSTTPADTSGGQGFGSSADEPGRLSNDPPNTRVPKVRLGKLSLTDKGEDSADAARAIRVRVGDYRACYEEGLARKADLEGRVVYRFNVQSDGSVAGVQVQQSALSDEAVVKCVQKALGAVRFEARERKNAAVEVPLVFAL